MRLTEPERCAIIETIGAAVAGMSAKLYLYGSRTDDNARGGDIDLLLVVDAAHHDRALTAKYQMLANLKAAIGERRIDLTIASTGDIGPFLANVLPTAIELHLWTEAPRSN